MYIKHENTQLSKEDESYAPKRLESFIGQDYIKDNLSVFTIAARQRNEPLDHVLLHGPPGLGKTTLAHIIANEMEGTLKSTSGPMLSKPADLAGVLTNLKDKDVLFIDEIHRINISLEEVLYGAMENFSIDILVGEGNTARPIKLPIPKFTLVGATTRIGLLSNPLRDRFGIHLRTEFYSAISLQQIITKACCAKEMKISDTAALEIAERSRGTPRIALRLLRRVADFALIEGTNYPITIDIATKALEKLKVDKKGLDINDYKYLTLISENYNGGPVGIDTIASSLSEQKDTIEEMIEPYMLQIGFVQKTPRGRVLSHLALEYLCNNRHKK
ncbi:Holliday junction branch migration DNA helicase RuvB [Candidatus Sneabacter namystus]|uniref:Holliday junction branch migration complex subunit RuvB n=1 Tax=Candidatus Sneabacter namystus TaxID=2601646 RepID=A0A5C0UKE6_9RICK|nr:Holliday junction branch migration DNA helicase RuvB [Candidatus Sneabacter namystus]QEK39334.1 Holliday junction branch migration DNA helicase RuvB [Candidatus Sneabacter namystus]